MSAVLVEDDGTELVGGITKRWRPHERTARRANDLGLDLRRWPTEEPAAGWQQDASCRGVDNEVADALSDCVSQTAATELVGRFCSSCPVRVECFEAGRATRGWGVWGGIAIREGRIATWRTAAERSRRAASAETAETAETVPTVVAKTQDDALGPQIEELERPKAAERMEAGVTLGSAEPRVPKAMSGEQGPRSADLAAGAVGMSRVTTTHRRRGQRAQPRRRTRARRRGRRASAT